MTATPTSLDIDALPGFPAAVAGVLRCKICRAAAPLAGFVDFARDVYDYNAAHGVVAGIPVPYYRCGDCRFGFTDRFDDWTGPDWTTHVYNAAYHLYDPRYAEARPQKTVRIMCDVFPDRAHSVLDYGAGNGRTAELLREAGFGPVATYDPHHGNPCKPVGRTFDIVICIEVAEHTTDPLALFDELHAYCAPDGVILFSTKDFSSVKAPWLHDGYVAPRNGHVSLFSRPTFETIAERLGRSYHRVDTYRHLLLPPAT